MAGSPLRFAVLRHTGVPQEHFDLLIETSPDRPLATWKCMHWPLPQTSINARQPDHRRIYLDYEGMVPGGRGEVIKVAGGQCAIHHANDDEIAAILELPCGRLDMNFRRRDADNWEITVRQHPGQ